MSKPTIVKTALEMILRAVSPIPIGRTPGCLSKAISRLASRGPTLRGTTIDEHILLATEASEEQRSLDAPL